MAKKSVNIWQPLSLGMFLSGMMAMAIMFVVALLVGKYIFQKKQNANNQIVAPHYDQKAFQMPQDMQTKASTNSSQLAQMALKVPILMYHYVEYVKDVNDLIRKKLDINPVLFEAHLKVLHENNYHTYFVKDLPAILNGTIAYSDKSIILTFDDGYEDFYTDVFPLLKKYQMKATEYIIYDYINRKGFMNDQEIHELAGSGLVEIGAHTLDHLYLKKLPVSVAKTQIFDSKAKLEQRFGIKVETFAYPYGAFDQEVVDLVKQAGYTAAVTVMPGAYHSTDNLFYLTRIRPGVFVPSTMIKVLDSYKK